MRVIIAAAATAAIISAALQAATVPSSRPVMVGSDDDLDACLSTGEVRGLNPKGDGFLSVRAAPSVKAAERDRIRERQPLWLCDESTDGEWLGVVYTAKGTDCGVGTPRPRSAYRGPCKSGWVARRYVQLLAG